MLEDHFSEQIANFNTVFVESTVHVAQVEEKLWLLRALLIFPLASVEIEGPLLDDKVGRVRKTSHIDLVNKLLLVDCWGLSLS